MKLITCLALAIATITVFAGALMPQYAYGFGALLGIEFTAFMVISVLNGGKEGRKA